MTDPSDAAQPPSRSTRPIDLLAVRVFLVAMMALLAGYMFLGRGFAHLGFPPVYVGELVLAIGLVATAIAIVRFHLRVKPSPLVWVLVLFMALGAARTLPFLGQDPANALRDGTLWGYGVFALIVYALADRAWVTGAFRAYGWIVPIFAVWLPIAYSLFGGTGSSIPVAPGSAVPILFFKNQDMAVHTVGAIAFLVVGRRTAISARWPSLWRFAFAVPLAWAVLTTGSFSRGALAAVIAGLAVLVIAVPRSKNWLPIVAAAVLVAVFEVGNLGAFLFGPNSGPGPSPTRVPSVTASPSPAASPSPVASPSPGVSPTPSPLVTPIASPTAVGRAVGPEQWIKNISSILGASSDANLEGTKSFRLAWWSKIVGYTVFGPYFWAGKGFGINLADADGFQPTADHSLRTPHNATFDVLARMGVPGFILWIVLQLGFFVALVRSIVAHRRVGDVAMAAAAIWILVYWTAIMVNASFDPYLEGPQGGIWFWTLFGLGLVVIRLAPRLRWR